MQPGQSKSPQSYKPRESLLCRWLSSIYTMDVVNPVCKGPAACTSGASQQHQAATEQPTWTQATYQQGYGTVLDSGTTFTYLPQEAYREFQKQVVAVALAKGARQVAGPDPKVPI